MRIIRSLFAPALIVLLAACGTSVTTTQLQPALFVLPEIYSFTATPKTLPPGGGVVTLSWDVDALKVSIDNGIGVVTKQTSVTVNLTQSTIFKLTATNRTVTNNAWVSVIVEITPIFVNPLTGNDTNAGTDAAPFKTLAKALSVARSGQVVNLQDGTYSRSSGENFDTFVPDGVTVQAVNSGRAVLVGNVNSVGLQFAGSGIARGLTLKSFEIGITTRQGVQTLSNLTLTQNLNGVDVVGTAQTSVERSSINANQEAGIVMDGANNTLRFTDGTISGNNYGIAMTNGGNLVVYNSNLNNNAMSGIQAGNSYANPPVQVLIRLRNTQITNNGTGISLLPSLGVLDLGKAWDLGGNTFQGNTLSGIYARGHDFQPVQAVGNTWNPYTQGADAFGHYTASQSVSGAASGLNYTLESSGIQF